MVQNLWRVQFQGGDCPPPEELRGGTKNFSGASRPICPPPELNPVSATVYIYIEWKEILTINVMWTVALGIWHWYQIKIWISLVQNKFCLCLSFLEKEMNSAEPFALKKMMMFMPRSNLCWRYYKHLQFLPYIIHMYIFLAYRTPRCHDLLLSTAFFCPSDTL